MVLYITISIFITLIVTAAVVVVVAQGTNWSSPSSSQPSVNVSQVKNKNLSSVLHSSPSDVNVRFPTPVNVIIVPLHLYLSALTCNLWVASPVLCLHFLRKLNS